MSLIHTLGTQFRPHSYINIQSVRLDATVRCVHDGSLSNLSYSNFKGPLPLDHSFPIIFSHTTDLSPSSLCVRWTHFIPRVLVYMKTAAFLFNFSCECPGVGRLLAQKAKPKGNVQYCNIIKAFFCVYLRHSRFIVFFIPVMHFFTFPSFSCFFFLLLSFLIHEANVKPCHCILESHSAGCSQAA